MSRSELIRVNIHALPAMMLPVIILGGIYSGIVTVTEAAGVAAFAAMFISLIYYRGCTLQEIPSIMAHSIRMTGVIFFIILGALALGHWITSAGIADVLVDYVTENNLTDWQFLLLVNILMLVLGMFLETLAVILITVPVVLPLLEPLGISPIHYAVIVTVNMELALLTPPIGLNLYVLSSITGARIETVTRGVVPFVLIMLVLLMMVTFIPELSLFLPQLVYGK
jgi:C4-dicarboxylate transporter DctM subunit